MANYSEFEVLILQDEHFETIVSKSGAYYIFD